MSYYVIIDGRNDLTLFLVDRSKTKAKWWTTDTIQAMAFKQRSAAEYSANRLTYKNPSVIGYEEAKLLEARNEEIVGYEDDHPFSSEALGQE